MFLVSSTERFDRNYAELVRRSCDMTRLDRAIGLLSLGYPLPREYRDHQLQDEREGIRECHVGGPKSDWLLVYLKVESQSILKLLETGTHNDLRIGVTKSF